MKYKTLKHKVTGEYGMAWNDKIITSEIPALMHHKVTYENMKKDLSIDLDQYKLIWVELREL